MTTQKLKTLIEQSGFTPDVQAVLMVQYADGADREMTKEEVQKIIDLMSVEIAAAEVTAKALEDAAAAFDEYIKETEAALQQAATKA